MGAGQGGSVWKIPGSTTFFADSARWNVTSRNILRGKSKSIAEVPADAARTGIEVRAAAAGTIAAGSGRVEVAAAMIDGNVAGTIGVIRMTIESVEVACPTKNASWT